LTYRVIVSSAAQRDHRKLPPELKRRIRDSVTWLAEDPRGQSQKLAGEDLYRKRIGDDRIVFRIDDRLREVLVARIKHRRDAYRR
jgi:mRNA interferase RelE/StbE